MEIEEVGPSSSLTRATTPNFCPYDVFINHRGIDVKTTLASLIYHRLTNVCGLRVFFDKFEMQQGNELDSQITNAIRTASVHIAIFSKNYANSKWCFDELLHMLESGAPIIPVFYDVKPCHLRWAGEDTGPYAEAFKMHLQKGRYDPETLQSWKSALHRVSNISGYELEACGGDLGELLEKIVKKLLRNIQKSQLHVADYPVGLSEAIEDFELLAAQRKSQSNSNAMVVGIVGLGGVGKTTLVSEFFNRRRRRYGGASFLDCREDRLNKLQGRFLEDLNHVNLKIGLVQEGKEILVSRLSSFHAMIVLDNVDRRDQLDAFWSLKDVLRSGSLILVTSRHKDLLSGSGISLLYELPGLNKQYSEELFCWHAFHQPRPLPTFENLVEQYLAVSGGLPLFLKVIGALLYGNDQSFWTCQLDKLNRMLPSEIVDSLKISYDPLDRHQQQIFLDIACFFVGEDKDLAIRVWDGFEWNGRQGLKTLQDKCLVEVDDKNIIKMHDILRYFGRNIADEESSQYPRRLWRALDVNDLSKQLCNMQDKREVRGIKNISGSYTCRISVDSIKIMNSMKSLKLVTANGHCLEGILKKASPKLVWIRWVDYPYDRIPPWISLKNLVVLELSSQRNFTTLWASRSQAPVELRELNINGCLSNLPESIGELTHLEKLVLGRKADDKGHACGSRMKALPDSFCNLTSLKHLELICCENLKLLPDRFGNLTNLQHISICYCTNLSELPESFSNLVQLRHLFLEDCTQLNISTEILDKISELEYLNLKGCSKVRAFPIDVAHHDHVKDLNLRETKMKRLKMRKSGRISKACHASFSDSTSLLKRISLHGAKIPTIYLSENICPNLEDLDLSSCHDLSEVKGLPRTLVKLDFSDCGTLKEVSGLSQCVQLRELDIRGCVQLKQLLNLELLTSLEKLRARRCYNLRGLKGLEKLPNLAELDVSMCRELVSLAGEGRSGSLETEIGLASDGCFKRLERLYAIGCWNLLNINGLQKMKRLKELQISPIQKKIWNEVQGLDSTLQTLILSGETIDRGDVEQIMSSFASYLNVFKAKRESPLNVFRGKPKFPWKVSLPMHSRCLILCLVMKDSTVYLGMLRSLPTTEFECDIMLHTLNGSVGVQGVVSDSTLVEIPVGNKDSPIKVADAWLVSRGRRDEPKLRELWNQLCSSLFTS